MPFITLRAQSGVSSENDLVVEVKQNTFDYLLNSSAPNIRVSAYLDRDWPQVEARYAELLIQEDCQFESRIVQIIPGSRTRNDIQLPGPMQQGEQLTLLVNRAPASASR